MSSFVLFRNSQIGERLIRWMPLSIQLYRTLHRALFSLSLESLKTALSEQTKQGKSV